MRNALLASAALALLAACGQAPAEAPAPTSAEAAPSAVAHAYDTVAEGLEFPWGMAFLPNGDMLVTEREGRLRIIRDGALDPTPIANTPEALVERQGGYLSIALDPDFETNRIVFLSYSSGTPEANQTVIHRARLSDDATALEDGADIFGVTPLKRSGFHFGSRFAFLPDGTMLVSFGDGGRYQDEAQNLENHLGTIIRLNRDGSVPPDNPFIGVEGAQPEIFSYGHRNVQGMVYDPATGVIWTHEHGPKGGDELNRVEAGKNYGWPVITYGINYDGTIITEATEAPGMEQPVVHWTPSIAVCGLALYGGDAFPQWKGDLLVGALAGMEVRRVDLENGEVVGQESLFKDLDARVRDVIVGPDGFIYLALDDIDGRIVRVRPAAQGA